MAASPSPVEVESIFKIDVLANRMFLASAVLYVYDTLLTLPMEIHGVWYKKWNATSILYATNRYIYILAQFTEIIASFGDGSSSIRCTVIGIVSNLGLVLGGVLTSCLFTLRMYALYGQNVVVLLGLGILIVIQLIIDILDTFVAQMNEKSSDFLATGSLNTTAAVLALQVVNTTISVHAYVTQAQVQNTASTFFQLLSPFENMTTVLLANRLYLNLKTWDDHDTDASQHTRQLSGINFAGSAMLGRIGAPIRTMDEDILYSQPSIVEQNPDEGEANNSTRVQAENMTVFPVVCMLF
ncbi:uncharacterized protein STEHIDRAFT_154847 [Stereum hirsutum FP-91666 SS1]|uniref:uncharacterized protein n=1 Tax=Stereum hirsutum (strain FP-91666) TaxID=721885 RepID=UPI000440FA81|nr:uncharacterized protein STEHIDRAFT_154847 [Stereum hirsutum FP-91666 SS1]EIM89165.1 hypothetical protein STEHIDRAFT_154847 [Stereum hirsutum FP-91666 SS1]